MKLPFTTAEYKRRVEQTKTSMQKAGIDVLFVTDPANMNYLTGYDGWSFYVHQLVAVAGNESEPVWFGRPMDANGARVTTYLKHSNIYDYPDHFVQSTKYHPMDRMAEIARERGWAKARIGVEKEAYYFTAGAMESLQKNLPKARFKDATSLVNWVRVVKSKKELEYMSEAARIAERVMRTGINNVRPGVRQCDAAAEIWRAGVRGTSKFGAQRPGSARSAQPLSTCSARYWVPLPLTWHCPWVHVVESLSPVVSCREWELRSTVVSSAVGSRTRGGILIT